MSVNAAVNAAVNAGVNAAGVTTTMSAGGEATTPTGYPLTRETLEAVLGFRVLDFDKYLSVFTHKSAVRDTGLQSYERYEYMGDAVINFVVAKYLYDRFPDADEGFLTRVRTKLVSGSFLSELAGRLGLQHLITMNRKAIQQGWYTNPRIMEDVFESLVGCIYLDLGLMTARNFLLAVIEQFARFQDVLKDTNYKDALMRYAQARGLALPEYRVLNDPQVTRQPMFRVVAALDGVEYGQGMATAKKAAEQKAAEATLQRLGALPSTIF
jgi:ribonuclease-3